MEPLPEFTSEPERQRWIIDHAEYFTCVRFRNRKYEREEAPNLEKAQDMANTMVKNEPQFSVMIYAVYGGRDTFVRAVRA